MRFEFESDASSHLNEVLTELESVELENVEYEGPSLQNVSICVSPSEKKRKWGTQDEFSLTENEENNEIETNEEMHVNSHDYAFPQEFFRKFACL